MNSMRPFLWFFVTSLLVVACDDGSTRATRSEVQIDTAVSLGRPFVGDTGTATLNIRSISSGPVRVLRIAPANTTLQLSWDRERTTLAPGAALPVQVRWMPSEPGLLATTIEVETDVEATPLFTVQVTGEGRAIPDCDDRNECTDDLFDKSVEQCRHTNHARACNDGNACTDEDQCQGGVCKGVGKTCDDDNVCTLNLCDPTRGCVFPPDGRQCDDGDPCTDNVCDPDDGCSFPDAKDGTTCGPFSCAMAHVCVFGTCRELDISGSSDGFPCSDGNRCTVNDTCQAGQCAPGEPGHPVPQLVASLDTYGGVYAFVATDGFRYLFIDHASASTDLNGLRMTVLDGAQLRQGGALKLVTTTEPVMVAPGKFAVAHGSMLALVDATDVDHPVVAWDVTVEPSRFTSLRTQKLARVPGGLIAVVESYPPTAGERAYVMFLPLAEPALTPGSWKQVSVADNGDVVDVNGDSVMVMSWSSPIWFRFDATGTVVESVPIESRPPYPIRLSVEGRRAMLYNHGTLRVVELDTTGRAPVRCTTESNCRDYAPACDASFPYPAGRYLDCSSDSSLCPAGSHCEGLRADSCPACDRDCLNACCDDEVHLCMTNGASGVRELNSVALSGAEDVVLSGDVLYVSTTKGVQGYPLVDVIKTPSGTTLPAVPVLDPFPAQYLERGPEHLLSRGRQALPLKLSSMGSGMVPVAERVTGVGHGEVSAIVDVNERTLLVGGQLAVGEIDLEKHQFSNWTLMPTPSSRSEPRVLQGLSRTVAIDDFADGEVMAPPICGGERVTVVERQARTSEMLVCGLYSASFAIAGGQLWSASDTSLNITNALPDRGWRAWDLSSTEQAPSFDPGPIPFERAEVVRASADGKFIAALSRYSSSMQSGVMRVRLFDPSARGMPLKGEFSLEGKSNAQPQTAMAVNTDGTYAMTVRGGTVRLHPLGAETPTPTYAAAGTLPQVTFPNALGTNNDNVASMSNGRAWVGWKTVDPVGSMRMSEIHYDWQLQSLERTGDFSLPGRLLNVHETDDYSVATTSSGVVIISPSCR